MVYIENSAPHLVGEVSRRSFPSTYFRNEEEILDKVEYPVALACVIWWQKNILTVWSTANRKDTFASVILDHHSLSEPNKEIANTLCTRTLGGAYEIRLAIHPMMETHIIRNYFSARASAFLRQKMIWAPRYSIHETQQTFTSLAYNWDTHPPTLLEESEFIRRMAEANKGYFDAGEGMFYMSYEHYVKSHEEI